MRILLDKANENLEASALLHDEDLYASSIHCSYYSCVQLIRHIIFNIYNQDEYDFDNYLQKLGAGSHNYLISFFRQQLISESVDIREFSLSLKNLKDLRKRADYQQQKIFISDSNKALNVATKINAQLKRVYSL